MHVFHVIITILIDRLGFVSDSIAAAAGEDNGDNPIGTPTEDGVDLSR